MVPATLSENRTTAEFMAGERGPARAVSTTEPAFARTAAWLRRPIFNRPAFLDAPEVRRLDADLRMFFDLLAALPERFFDGTPVALGRALGIDPAQAEAIARTASSGPPARLGRADLLRDRAGFKLVEYNSSSSLGGCEIAEMNRAMLADAGFAAFAGRAGLDFGDPVDGIMATMLGDAAGEVAAARTPIAVLQWPNSPERASDYGHMSLFLAGLRRLGLDAMPCHVGELAYRDGKLFAGGRPVSHLYRTFQLGRFTGTGESRELAEPLLDALADGAATMFAPLAADLYGVKGCLALLSEERHRSAFGAAELDVIDRLLPWTRAVRDERVSRDGATVDLLSFARDNRERLILKPSFGFAGRGIVAGWMVDRHRWEEELRTALRGSYVVQERVEPRPERFVSEHDPEAISHCILNWGAFLTGRGYSGAFVKGIPDADQDVRFLGDGSHVGCVFHVAGDPGRPPDRHPVDDPEPPVDRPAHPVDDPEPPVDRPERNGRTLP